MKMWKFRYCYWSSSQSFVFTRGWNQFVQEKQLKANDAIVFCFCNSNKEKTKEDRMFFMIDVNKGVDKIKVATDKGAGVQEDLQLQLGRSIVDNGRVEDAEEEEVKGANKHTNAAKEEMADLEEKPTDQAKRIQTLWCSDSYDILTPTWRKTFMQTLSESFYKSLCKNPKFRANDQRAKNKEGQETPREIALASNKLLISSARAQMSVTLHTNLGDIKCEIFCEESEKGKNKWVFVLSSLCFTKKKKKIRGWLWWCLSCGNGDRLVVRLWEGGGGYWQ